MPNLTSIRQVQCQFDSISQHHYRLLHHISLSTTIKKLFVSYILVNDFTIETPVSFAIEQLKTIGVCKKKQ